MFDDKRYLQINGTAMETKMVPAFANNLMHYVENTFLSSFNLQPTAYLRYIDVIFLIWPHGIVTFKTFVESAK